MTGTRPQLGSISAVPELAESAHPTARAALWGRAMVTGASSGIGDAFARRLAAMGVDLVLVARDEARLDSLATAMTEAHGIEVEVLVADLGSPVSRAAVEKRLADPERPVDLLVNNAGFGTRGSFVELPVAREEQEVEVNVVAVMRLCSAALPGMVERGHGNVLNVASVAGLYPSPGTATYAATKAFVCSFTDALHEELRGTGVSATAVLPGLTRSEFHERSGPGSRPPAPDAAWMTADEVAASALRAAASGRARVVPGVIYRMMAAFLGGLPTGARRRFVGRVARTAR